jgi:phage-related protein
MASIYNIDNWAAPTGGQKFKKNTVVKDSNGLFWYATQEHDSSIAPAVGSEYWNGNTNITIGNSLKTVPYFFWKPSYNVQVSHDPRVHVIQYGDGYEQRIKDGINNNILKLNLSFEARSQLETTAILHFLNDKEGWGPFYFKAPEPYSLIKKFVCETFNSSFVFDDNYNIQCSLREIS